MTFQRWWDRNDMDADPYADYTFSEQLWHDARKDLRKDQRDRRARKKKKKKGQAG